LVSHRWLTNPAAIANAVYDAVGIRLYEMPFTPERVLAALGASEQSRVEPTESPAGLGGFGHDYRILANEVTLAIDIQAVRQD
jgi:hypothetical protein